MARDPVCGVFLDEETAKYKTIRRNNVYYFCSATCENKFEKNPESYMSESSVRHAAHYGGYCTRSTCGPPARGPAWYFYIGLLFLLLLLLLVMR